SSGIDAIERGAKEARGRGGILVLCALQDPVRIAFELSGALSEMAVEPSLEAARARALR
ncbi:MAG: anti-sigma factor antagonist, partial [Acidobacteria bacterium]